MAGRDLRLAGVKTALEGVVALPEVSCEIDAPITAWEDCLAAGAGQELPESVGEQYADEVCDIIYTSGSTSAPKGVLLTHDMLMRSAYASCINRGFEMGRRVFVPLPMIHCYGYVEGMLACILVGGAILFHSGKFRAEPALRFMAESRANDVLSVPSQMMAVINYLKENPMELPHLHAVYCSAAVCPAWVWPGIRSALKVDDLITGYGMSEVCGASMQTQPSDGDDILCSRVGRLLQGGCAGAAEYGGCQLEYQVTDQQTGEPCKPGESCGAGGWWSPRATTTGRRSTPRLSPPTAGSAPGTAAILTPTATLSSAAGWMICIRSTGKTSPPSFWRMPSAAAPWWAAWR